MSVENAVNRSGGAPSAKVAGIVLGLLALAICIWRIRYVHEPFENDITIRMAYAARSAAGARYYSDLFVFGPPGALWINEVFYRLFGTSDVGVYVMGCVFSVLTLLGVYRCTRALTDVSGGLVAAAVWALVSADLFTQANQPNAEVFINAALVWAFALLVDPRAATSRRYPVLAGLLCFAASSVKHFVAITPMLAAAFAVFLPMRRSDGWNAKPDAEALRTWAVVGVAALAPWALLLGGYAATDRLVPFLGALFGSSLQYATQHGGLLDNLAAGARALLPPHQLPFVFLYAFLLAAILGGLLRARDPRWRMVLGWALGTWLSVSFSGRFYAHYSMLWLPLISIGTGALFGLAQALPRQRLAMGLRAAIAVAILATGARQVSQIVLYDAQAAVLHKYGYVGAVFTEIRAVGKRLAETMPAGASLFELGAHGIYFYALRPAPGPFVDSIYGIDGAFPAAYREKMLPALLRSPPDVLVVRRSVLKSDADVALREVLAELLKDVAYVEDKERSGEHLLVLRRHRPEVPGVGESDRGAVVAVAEGGDAGR